MDGRYSPVTDDEGEDSHPSKRGDVRPVNVDPEALVRVKASILDEELSCPVCMCILDETYTVMECLHRFCRECISRSLRLGKRECPACRTKVVSKRSLRPDYAFDGLIRMLHPDREAYEESRLELAGKIAKERALILGAPEKKKAGQAASAPSATSKPPPKPRGREVVVNPVVAGAPRKGPAKATERPASKTGTVSKSSSKTRAAPRRLPSPSSDETETLNDSEKTETESEKSEAKGEATLAEMQAKLLKEKKGKEKPKAGGKGNEKESVDVKKKTKGKKGDPNAPKRGRGRPPLSVEEKVRRQQEKAKAKSKEAEKKKKRASGVGMVPGQTIKLPPKSNEPELNRPLLSGNGLARTAHPVLNYRSLAQYQHEILGRAAVKMDTEICARRGSKCHFVSMMNYYKSMLREQGKLFDESKLPFDLCSKKPAPIRPMLAKLDTRGRFSDHAVSNINRKRRAPNRDINAENAKRVAKVPVEIIHVQTSDGGPTGDDDSQDDSVDEWKDEGDSYVSFALLPHPGAPTEQVLDKPYMRTRHHLTFGDLSEYLQQILSSQNYYKSKYAIYAVMKKEMREMKSRDKVGDILGKDSAVQLLFYKNESTSVSFKGLVAMNKFHDITIKM